MFNGIKANYYYDKDRKTEMRMAFDFVENFTVKLPDFSHSDFNFKEAANSHQGLIIEVAAIHEGLTRKL